MDKKEIIEKAKDMTDEHLGEGLISNSWTDYFGECIIELCSEAHERDIDRIEKMAVKSASEKFKKEIESLKTIVIGRHRFWNCIKCKGWHYGEHYKCPLGKLNLSLQQKRKEIEALKRQRDYSDRFECPKCGILPYNDVTTKKTCLRCGEGLIRHNSIEEAIRKSERQSMTESIEKLIDYHEKDLKYGIKHDIGFCNNLIESYIRELKELRQTLKEGGKS